MILRCTAKCTHAFQDNRHGKGKRVFNPTMKAQGDDKVWRCGVCLNEQVKGAK